MCTRATWHGRTVCAHMVPKLNEWQELCGGVYLKPIQGSYNTSVSASAGTHTGGGAIDISTSYMTTERRTWIMTNARKALLVGWQRNAISGVWSSHNHAIDPSCPSLASAARTQVSLFHQGYNGLVGNNRDPGWRGNATYLWDLYLIRSKTTVYSIQKLFQSVLPTPPTGEKLFPYGPFPYPYKLDSMYGPTTAGKPWYMGTFASPTRSKSSIQYAIRLIQHKVGVAQDGLYGPATMAAVKRWQTGHNILADGVVGPFTWAWMQG